MVSYSTYDNNDWDYYWRDSGNGENYLYSDRVCSKALTTIYLCEKQYYARDVFGDKYCLETNDIQIAKTFAQLKLMRTAEKLIQFLNPL